MIWYIDKQPWKNGRRAVVADHRGRFDRACILRVDNRFFTRIDNSSAEEIKGLLGSCPLPYFQDQRSILIRSGIDEADDVSWDRPKPA